MEFHFRCSFRLKHWIPAFSSLCLCHALENAMRCAMWSIRLRCHRIRLFSSPSLRQLRIQMREKANIFNGARSLVRPSDSTLIPKFIVSIHSLCISIIFLLKTKKRKKFQILLPGASALLINQNYFSPILVAQMRPIAHQLQLNTFSFELSLAFLGVRVRRATENSTFN